jgi:hypothetical protein
MPAAELANKWEVTPGIESPEPKESPDIGYCAASQDGDPSDRVVSISEVRGGRFVGICENSGSGGTERPQEFRFEFHSPPLLSRTPLFQS